MLDKIILCVTSEEDLKDIKIDTMLLDCYNYQVTQKNMYQEIRDQFYEKYKSKYGLSCFDIQNNLEKYREGMKK